MKAEWRSVLTMYGVRYVMTFGEEVMLLWYVGNWATPLKVIIMNIKRMNQYSDTSHVFGACIYHSYVSQKS